MSYDLVFWRQEAVQGASPRQIDDDLLEGRRVDGLAELPIDGLLGAIVTAFPGALREPNGEREWLVWTAPDEHAAFEVWWSPQHVLVTCRHTENDLMNRLIDIAVEHGCRLYDPQTRERFDST